MNLLLLLSALLSALSGVGVSARRTEATQIVAQATSARSIVVAATPAGVRPAQGWQPLMLLFDAVQPALVCARPIWVDRRRE